MSTLEDDFKMTIRWRAIIWLPVFLCLCFSDCLRAQTTEVGGAASTGASSGESEMASGSVAAARREFEDAVAAWKQAIASVERIRIRFQATTAESEHPNIQQELRAAIKAAEPVVDRFTSAAIDLLGAGGPDEKYVSQVLEDMAQFYALGNKHGDGGDQYERVLPIAQALVEAGVASANTALLGGIAAFCVSDYDQAERFFQLAAEQGALGDAPPTLNPQDPQVQLWERSRRYAELVPDYRKLWQREQELRAAEAEDDDLPRVKLITTEGDIVVELFENEAPQAVANFIHLVKQGFYDGLSFHRVLPGFMAQGGDNQRGGPGYTIRCECFQDDYRHHFRGSLSMAKPAFPPRDSGSAQFYLTFAPTAHLDGKHTVFGRVIEGIHVAAALKRKNPEKSDPHDFSPADKILRAEVLRDRGHEYAFDKLQGSRNP